MLVFSFVQNFFVILLFYNNKIIKFSVIFITIYTHKFRRTFIYVMSMFLFLFLINFIF